MGVIGDLRSLVGRAPVERPPTEIYAALVDNLYAPFASFALGAAVPPLAGGIAAWRTGSVWLTALSIGAAAVAVLRVSILLEYRRHKPAIGADALALRDWSNGTRSALQSSPPVSAPCASSSSC